ncbi:EamA-like transporter family protein [Alteribacillus iranensis]|uniref:EamA-like transporter family protein n=1 Tax=Alteribacillus iranensis TaxID=930128 RepID=A0A1I2DRK0_9BACI|nr:EamA family transporter [Alteribacillus iranensis]SFE82943.1 EamA-like transporter family protein [Alteribacillus iranensis]
MGYIYIFGTVFFTVYGQIILKWQISKYGGLPPELWDKVLFVLRLLLDPLILSGFLSAFVASLFWMAAMTKFDISYAYPFMSLSFGLVFLLSIFLFHEPITAHKVIGLALIIAGILVTSQSA